MQGCPKHSCWAAAAIAGCEEGWLRLCIRGSSLWERQWWWARTTTLCRSLPSLLLLLWLALRWWACPWCPAHHPPHGEPQRPGSALEHSTNSNDKVIRYCPLGAASRCRMVARELLTAMACVVRLGANAKGLQARPRCA